MKNLSLLVVAIVLALPVVADEANAAAPQPLTLASADTSVSVNLQSNEASELSLRIDQDVKNASDALRAKIEAELPAKIAKASGITF